MEKNSKHIDPVELLPKYFAGEATIDEQKTVDEWRAVNPEYRKEFGAFAKLWNISGPVAGLGDIDIDAEWARMEKQIAPAKTTNLRRVLRVAAAVLILASLSFLGIKYLSVETQKSSIAELKEVTLPDGSVVSLNANSKISYKKGFGKTHRNISLTGEAYFEVAKNAKIPFIISANQASIKVVGTKFNVKAYKNKPEVKVMVTEGIVKVYETKQPEKEVTLVAGESATFNKQENVIRKAPTLNLNDIAWKTQVINLNNTPLSEVAEILNNTYHVDIEIDPVVRDCPITVDFTKQEFPSVLEVLRKTLNLTIKVDGKHVKISGGGC
jgi:transmembrane sensor